MNEKNNIPEEFDNLKDFAPVFSKIKKQNSFGVPENYFENLPFILHDKCIEAEELKEIAPVLSCIEKENAFIVPNDYFDHLPYSIRERISAEKHRFAWTEKLIGFLRPKFAIPLTMTVIIVVIGLTLNKNSKKTENTTFASNKVLKDYAISSEEIDQSYYLNNIDEATLIEEIDIKQFSKPDNNRIIEDYLMDNHTDVSQIINQSESL